MITSAEERLLAGLVRAIRMNSRGWVDAVEAVSEDGVPIAHESDNPSFNSEYVAAAAAAVCGAISAVIELMGAKGYKRFNIQLDDGRSILIRQYRGVLCGLLDKAKPEPRLRGAPSRGLSLGVGLLGVA
jgi:predicted regulator of Ras-like GTPase activity (Roadblock/LC7/MglB family)